MMEFTVTVFINRVHVNQSYDMYNSVYAEKSRAYSLYI